jgi:hypothetical protein
MNMYFWASKKRFKRWQELESVERESFFKRDIGRAKMARELAFYNPTSKENSLLDYLQAVSSTLET